MFKRMGKWIADCLANHEGLIAVLMVLGIVVLCFGLTFGGYCLTGWILMLIYNLIKPTLNLPELSYWVFVGVAFVISLLKPSVSVKNKGD